MKMESNSLDVTDYLILGSITKGITKYTNIFKNCKKTNAGKFKDHVNKLEEIKFAKTGPFFMEKSLSFML